MSKNPAQAAVDAEQLQQPAVETVAETQAAKPLEGLAAELQEAEIQQQAPEAQPRPPVECRVLTACGFGNPNDVVTVSAEEAGQGAAVGELDPHPDAVAYAKTL